MCKLCLLYVFVVAYGRRGVDLGADATRLQAQLEDLAPPNLAVQTSWGAHRLSTDAVEWHGTYGDCSVGCGKGVHPLLENESGGVTCIYSHGVAAVTKLAGMPTKAPRELCEKAKMPWPALTKPCDDYRTCKWHVGAPGSLQSARGSSDKNCGWTSDIFCAPGESALEAPAGESPGEKADAYCSKAVEEGLIESKVDFQSRHGMTNDGCKVSIQSICTVTLNQPAKEGLLDTAAKNLEAAKDKATKAMIGCDDADVVVIATQEMDNLFGHIFSDFYKWMSRFQGKSMYSLAGKCHAGPISPGVVVIVKRELRKFFAPVAGACIKDDDLHGGSAAATNTKGTVFLELFTVRGTLVAASTHGARGDVFSEPRVRQVQYAARTIMHMKPSFVAWGGDFNTRTNVDGSHKSHEFLKLGASHPRVSSFGKESKTELDPHKDWTLHFDPRAVYRKLSSIPDILGGEDSKSLQQVVHEASEGKLVEVPPFSLCPTYRKGSVGKFKDTDMNLLKNGNTEKAGWMTPRGAVRIQEWRPNFACQSPGSAHPEYFLSPLDGKTKWPSRAPSWCERLIVHANRKSCRPPQKVAMEEDHDTLYVRCDI